MLPFCCGLIQIVSGGVDLVDQFFDSASIIAARLWIVGVSPRFISDWNAGVRRFDPDDGHNSAMNCIVVAECPEAVKQIELGDDIARASVVHCRYLNRQHDDGYGQQESDGWCISSRGLTRLNSGAGHWRIQHIALIIVMAP